MPRISLLILVLFLGHTLFAQQSGSGQAFAKTDSNFITQENPCQFRFGHFFKTAALYAILLDTSNDNSRHLTYCRLRFFVKLKNEWQKKSEFDSLSISKQIQTRFHNYSTDSIKDYLLSAGIVGTGGNETEYLFIFDSETESMKLVKGFENLPSTSYNAKTGTITSIGLAAGIPNFEYYKIADFKLVKIAGKEMWSEDGYGYQEKYKVVNGEKIVYYKAKKKLPIDFYSW